MKVAPSQAFRDKLGLKNYIFKLFNISIDFIIQKVYNFIPKTYQKPPNPLSSKDFRHNTVKIPGLKNVIKCYNRSNFLLRYHENFDISEGVFQFRKKMVFLVVCFGFTHDNTVNMIFAGILHDGIYDVVGP